MSQGSARSAVRPAARASRVLAPLAFGVLLLGVPAASARPAVADSWIVKLREGTSVAAALDRARAQLGIQADRAFRSAFRGYSARLTTAQAQRLRADPMVAAVVPDARVELAADPQPAPPGITRVGANPSAVRAIDGSDPELDVDIAIIDTGIANHADLNIHGGHNCTTANPDAWGDQHSHGTHVAGAAAARDNGFGVVGVAPGARVWSVKVMDASGGGLVSWLICGLDWVASQTDPADASRPLFEVANMSLSVRAADDGDCGQTRAPTAYDLLHQSICSVNRAGVTNVVAAGNYSEDAGNRVPAAYGEVITVGAICDSDGRPGGKGAACRSDSTDDGWAGFSNFGPGVDIVAPGARIWSTMPPHMGSGYGFKDGTSLATPHVSGGAALYYLREAAEGRPRPTPEQVRAGLIAASLAGGGLAWRRGTYPLGADLAPPLLDVSMLDPEPGFGLGATPSSRRAGAGDTVFFDVWLGRYGGYAGDIDVELSGLPSGTRWSVAGAPSVASTGDGWQRVEVSLPSSGSAGSYAVSVNGSATGVAPQSASVTLHLEASFSVAALPRVNLRATTVGGVAFPARVAWNAVSGAQRYELQASREDGPWQDVALASALTRGADVALWPGARYRFRYRVMKDGTWRTWQTSYAYVATPEMAHDDGVELSGAWTPYTSGKAYSEMSSFSSQAGASLTFPFHGRSVAWLAPKGPGRGKAAVYVDGARVATVDLYAASTTHRQVVFTRAWKTPGAHTLRIVVLGTSGRPRVDVDAIVYVGASN